MAKKKSQEHYLQTGFECDLFNSSHPYHTGYSFYSCSCGKWKTEAKEQDAVVQHLAHVMQVTSQGLRKP